PAPEITPLPYTTLFRSEDGHPLGALDVVLELFGRRCEVRRDPRAELVFGRVSLSHRRHQRLERGGLVAGLPAHPPQERPRQAEPSRLQLLGAERQALDPRSERAAGGGGDVWTGMRSRDGSLAGSGARGAARWAG